jgi:hypothetical protein
VPIGSTSVIPRQRMTRVALRPSRAHCSALELRKIEFRFFPDFESLIQTGGQPNIGEVMPLLKRTINFRATGRNNRGSFSYAELPVKIDANSGPFKIVSVSGCTSWAKGSTHRIQWDTAGTDRAPVNCTKVNLLLAIDGNPSKLFTLGTGIANSGSFTLTVPAFPLQTGHS